MSDTISGFNIDYAGELVHCEAAMHGDHYEITFNGNWIASVEHTENDSWVLANGSILPQDIIDEIGRRIEDKYE